MVEVAVGDQQRDWVFSSLLMLCGIFPRPMHLGRRLQLDYDFGQLLKTSFFLGSLPGPLLSALARQDGQSHPTLEAGTSFSQGCDCLRLVPQALHDQ